MLEILQFIFSDFWIFLGTLLLVCAVTQFRPIAIKKNKNKE